MKKCKVGIISPALVRLGLRDVDPHACFIQYNFIDHIYHFMQSDGNSFFGDVVLDSFNKASREEDRQHFRPNILNEILLDFYLNVF